MDVRKKNQGEEVKGFKKDSSNLGNNTRDYDVLPHMIAFELACERGWQAQG